MMVYLSLGSNSGDRQFFLRQALDELGKTEEIKSVSSMYETEPVGVDAQPWFLNMSIGVKTGCSPEEALNFCHKIERKFGRASNTHHQPRPIDIDILFYGDLVLDTAQLTIPHRELHKRRFVLIPLVEIAPDFRHPLLKKSIKELLRECQDTAIVRAVYV